MKIEQLLEDVQGTTQVVNEEIREITCDSACAAPGVLFACLPGEHFDGHDFAKEAHQKGAVILCQRDMGLSKQVLVENSRYAYAKVCANFYHNPAKSLRFIGVTGTNGKTTVTNIIKYVLTQAGIRTGLIGTIQNEIGSQVIKTSKTTPDPKEFQQLLCQMKDGSCEVVVMEVSSHALEQDRMADTWFETAAFTNLTQDHLDFHQSMENYYQAKKRLFSRCNHAAICVDDAYGERLSHETACLTFSAKDKHADVVAKEVTMQVDGVSFSVDWQGERVKVHFSTPGFFSVHNAMTAFLTCLQMGLPVAQVVNAIGNCPPVKGRSENIPTGRDFHVICDYAHSPDGLKNILTSIQGYKNGRLVAVFGCGGDRDRAKRPIMGQVAAQHADFLVVTSDNPRTENPDAIIDDIMEGVKRENTPYVRVTNRKDAIHYAIKNAKPGDFILLAGKGHEDYQVLGTKKIHFDEREIVAQALAEWEQ